MIGRSLAYLAGARADILAAAPGDRGKFVTLGGVLLSTAGLAAVSAGFAVHLALGTSAAVTIAVALGWGTVILNLDRMLVVSMSHAESKLKMLGLAIPRIGLAIVLGTVISTPLTLQVFHKEIDAEIVTIHAEASDNYAGRLAHDTRFDAIPDLEQKIAAEQALVAGNGYADPAVAPLDAAYQKELATWRQMQDSAQCEVNGTCGTHVRGAGDAYRAAKANLDAQQGVVAQAKAELDAGAALALHTAQDDLVRDSAEKQRLQDERTAQQTAFDATNADNSGILIRLQALERIGHSSSLLGTAQKLLALLFLLVELLPVLTKVLLGFSAESNYAAMSSLRDHGDLEIARMHAEARLKTEQAAIDVSTLSETERADRQKKLIVDIKHTKASPTPNVIPLNVNRRSTMPSAIELAVGAAVSMSGRS